MSTVEELLARDIAAVTEGVVVTESDLRDARDELDRRIDDRRQRDRRRVVVVAAAAAAVVVVGVAAWQGLRSDDASPQPARPGPTPTPVESPDPSDSDDAFLAGDAPTADLLHGVWRLDNGSSQLLLSFTSDGDVRFDDSGRLFGAAAVIGTYEIADDLITVHVDEGLAECAGQTFAMRASAPQPGALRFVHTQPGAGNCSTAQNERWELEQVLPTDEDLVGLDVPDGGAWDPPEDATVVRGAWMAEGGHHVLALTPEGSYAVAGESGDVVDRGEWSLGNGRASLVLVSGADSPTCGQGDRLVMGGLGMSYVISDHPGMRATEQRNDCGADWAKDVWIRLVP